jgi:hypothetical protein
VAIHQPNFFPWLGFFDKLIRCDRFILLDTAQHQKKGGTYGNRVKLLIGGEPRWVTAPICRGYHGVKPISAIQFDDRIPWRAKLSKTLSANYAKAPFLEETLGLIIPLLADPDDRLSNYNCKAIQAIARALGIDTGKMVVASELSVDGLGTELLISLTRRSEGTAYMCGGGSAGYQQDDLFTQAGLKLVYQNFSHPVYLQYQRPDRFVPGLSIIDALMNVGAEALRALLQEGRQAAV